MSLYGVVFLSLLAGCIAAMWVHFLLGIVASVRSARSEFTSSATSFVTPRGPAGVRPAGEGVILECSTQP